MRIKLQPNFYLDEFACKCKCKGVYTLNGRLVLGLQALRDDILVFLNTRHGWTLKATDIKMVITSGTRCKNHHRKIYEEREQDVIWSSRHIRGKASDSKIYCKGERVLWDDELLSLARKHFKGLGIPNSRKWLHTDIRDTEAEWEYPDE